jgi:hypothetical protein
MTPVTVVECSHTECVLRENLQDVRQWRGNAPLYTMDVYLQLPRVGVEQSIEVLRISTLDLPLLL